MAKLKITLKKSKIGVFGNNKKVLESLGLHKINQTVEHEDNSSIRGMIRKVDYLVEVEEI